MKKMAQFHNYSKTMTGLSISLLLVIGLQNCSTTNIQTGGTQYKPLESDKQNATREPESTFFDEMSRQDQELQSSDPLVDQRFVAADTKQDKLSRAADNCQCDLNKNKSAQEGLAYQKKEQRLDKYTDDSTDRRINLDQKAVLPTKEVSTDTQASNDHRLSGIASWYGRDFDGRPTASGQIFDSRKLTAAHKTIPLGSIALVRNIENGKEVLVTINDRGPYVGDRVLDISEYGAELLGYKEQGLTHVEINVVRMGEGKSASKSSKGATYEFFGPGSGYISQGAGDDSQANQQIEKMLERENPKPTVYTQKAVQRPDERQHESTQVLPESRQKGLAVQIGIFADQRNALNLKRYLESTISWQEPIYVYQRGDKFVVKMGSFKNEKEAEILKGKLILEGFKAFISKPAS